MYQFRCKSDAELIARTMTLPGFGARGTKRGEGIDGEGNGEGEFPQPSRKRGEVLKEPVAGSGAESQPKTILVLSERHRTPDRWSRLL